MRATSLSICPSRLLSDRSSTCFLTRSWSESNGPGLRCWNGEVWPPGRCQRGRWRPTMTAAPSWGTHGTARIWCETQTWRGCWGREIKWESNEKLLKIIKAWTWTKDLIKNMYKACRNQLLHEFQWSYGSENKGKKALPFLKTTTFWWASRRIFVIMSQEITQNTILLFQNRKYINNSDILKH